MKNYLRVLVLTLMVVMAGVGVSKVMAATELPIEQQTGADYVYRFWSDVFLGHFYSIDYNEAVSVKNLDDNWRYEKVAFKAYQTDAEDDVLPLFRFWSDNFRGHFYTSSYDEYLQVKDTDPNWNYEWIAYYVYPVDYGGAVKTKLVYRFWSPIFGHHFYTSDIDEMVRVRDTDSNWDYEGPVYRVPQ